MIDDASAASNAFSWMGRVTIKGAFEHAQNAHSDHPVHSRSIIRAFLLKGERNLKRLCALN